MCPKDEGLIVRQSAEKMYAAGQEIWPKEDLWHQHTRAEIQSFIVAYGHNLLRAAHTVLDAGCGRDTYQWMPEGVINIDRFYNQVKLKPRSIVGDLESLPFKAEYFDLIFCIGSVINYVSAFETLSEFARVTKARGHLFLQFETSTSFEQLGRPPWNATVHLNKTVNSSRVDHIWIYSPSYIMYVLTIVGFKVSHVSRFHLLSALLTRFGVRHDQAAAAARFDRAFSWLDTFADNVIVLAEKT